MSAATSASHVLGPVPDFLTRIPLDAPERERRFVRYQLLEQFNLATRSGNTPYTWGWTIFRTVYTPESEHIFHSAVAKLNRWLTHHVRSTVLQERGRNRAIPPELSNEIPERMRNDVVENRELLDGADWDTIYETFQRWILGQGVPEDWQLAFRCVPGNVRYNSCIVIDAPALDSINQLPDFPPEAPDEIELRRNPMDHQRNAWVWVLCARTMHEQRKGWNDAKPFSGWMKVHVRRLNSYWFTRMDMDRTMPFEEDEFEDGVMWFG